MMDRPNCYQCKHREEILWHSRCHNKNAIVVGDERRIKKGWSSWPLNFDPMWLKSCNGFEQK